ncbi:putative membrane protein [Synechococcus sp. SYN20]|nr:putative membrane protein [Synechococcus sp. SYN20]
MIRCCNDALLVLVMPAAVGSFSFAVLTRLFGSNQNRLQELES